MDRFVDAEFPANASSLGSEHLASAVAGWRRAGASVASATAAPLLGDAVVAQSGRLNSCWFLSALAAVAASRGGLGGLVLEQDPTLGRYTFRFYKVAAGGWVNVTIDDLLPIDRTGQLVFSGAATAMPSTEVAQAQALWPALFEKAYAKLHGSWHALNGGNAADALMDLTGGSVRTITRDQGAQDAAVMAAVARTLHRGGMVGCSYWDARQPMDGTAADNALDPHAAEGVIEARVTLSAEQPSVPLHFRTSDDAEAVARDFLVKHGASSTSSTAVDTDSVRGAITYTRARTHALGCAHLDTQARGQMSYGGVGHGGRHSRVCGWHTS